MDLHKVLLFLHERQRKGERTVLVTVCAVEGSSMRNPGTIMGVAEDGSYEGSLSGGCIENAVVAEALDALKAGRTRVVRFGAGSPYLDIRLPCGGGLDLHFAPLPDDADLVVASLCSINARQPFSIRVEPRGVSHCSYWTRPCFKGDAGVGEFGHWPAPKLHIIGHGASVEALEKQTRLMECASTVYTPDERIFASLCADGVEPRYLTRRTETDLLQSDPWSAFVFLFHDHDWEIDLMVRAFELPHFFLGAMGGKRAHVKRSEALRSRGISDEQIGAIRAPIGLFHSSRDPQTLALSTLSEVIRSYHGSDFETSLA